MHTQIFFTAFIIIGIPQSSNSNPMEIIQPLELRQMLEKGKYFRPWVARIRKGDPWALAELVLICENLSSYLDCGLGPMAESTKPGLESLRGSDPGRACYYLAEMTRITGSLGKREVQYISLLEESSGYGYPWAELKLYKESGQGGANSLLKLARIKDPEQHKAKLLELQSQHKEKAFRSLVPLAMKGNLEAQLAVYALHERRFDHFLDNAQARTLLEDSACRGSIRALLQIENLRQFDSNPEHPDSSIVEGSRLFRALEKAANQYDPPSIQRLVDFYVEKKDWAKAKVWATRGKEALGGTNRWLEKAWEDVNPPEGD